MKKELESAKDLTSKILDAGGDEAEAYRDALDKGLAATEPLIDMLNAMRSGDRAKVSAQLDGMADIIRTLEACDRMDAAIEDAKNGVEIQEVLDVIGTCLSIGIKVAALL